MKHSVTLLCSQQFALERILTTCKELSAPVQSSNWRTAHCQLAADFYLAYSQLTSTSEGHFSSVRKVTTHHAMFTRNSRDWIDLAQDRER
jgi:hypothetical protein